MRERTVAIFTPLALGEGWGEGELRAPLLNRMIRAQMQQFEDHGFLVLESHLPDEVLSFLQTAVESACNDSAESESTRRKRGVVFAQRNLLSLPWVKDFIASNEVRALLATLGPGLHPVRGILFDKTGDANWTVPWHQDRSIAVRERLPVVGFGPWSEKAGVVHVQPPVELLRRMVTIRFSVDPCRADNGSLRVIPTTHHTILSPTEVDEAVRSSPQTLCGTSAGGVVIMRPLILHASSPAKCPDHRRILHIEFGPPDLPGGLRWAKA